MLNLFFIKMTTTFVLKNTNPLEEHSQFTIATFTLTDENGNYDSISNIKYLWMPQHPDIYKGNVLCNFLLELSLAIPLELILEIPELSPVLIPVSVIY